MSHSLDVPSVDRCAFCDYLSGARPYVFLHRDECVAIAVTREQRGRSHLLVLPVEHYPTLLDLPDRLAGPLTKAVREAARAIAKAEAAEAVAVWQNNGLAAAQRIPHLHFHVAGTLPGGGTEFGPVPEISLDEARSIAEHLDPFFDGSSLDG